MDELMELEPLNELKWVDYEQKPGVRFEIRPLSSEEHSAMRKASKDKKGEFDMIIFTSKAAKKIINNWEGVGDFKRDASGRALAKDDNGNPVKVLAECTDVAKLKFGTRFAYTVMPWLIEQAMEFDQERNATLQDAKNG